MNLQAIIHNTREVLKSNAPTIFTGVSVVGTVSTAVLAARAGYKAHAIISADEAVGGTAGDRKQRIRERAKLTWKLYIPAVSSGVVTTVAIVGANKISAQRTAAAVTAYSLTETAFSEYKDQVIQTVTKNKEQAIRDQVATDRVAKSVPPPGTVIVDGSGDVLCCELHTQRYFMSTMEKLRRALNDVNLSINNDRYVPLDELYDALDLPYTSTSKHLGWTLERGLLDMTFSSVLTPDGRPCLAFDYNYLMPLP